MTQGILRSYQEFKCRMACHEWTTPNAIPDYPVSWLPFTVLSQRRRGWSTTCKLEHDTTRLTRIGQLGEQRDRNRLNSRGIATVDGLDPFLGGERPTGFLVFKYECTSLDR